ncbi:sulfite exporter TauE/SafE family protein [Marinagarivorans algicola]|uniref:HoxN/HupN/NixA family nickel/cobalt transporter n=1 Tax=Marinagarivorans algicola TaxID=1513270 RepID=UPI0006B47F9A|nr:sulfite exporter TauE/SafE family protein [Marinagarivorans algicola]
MSIDTFLLLLVGFGLGLMHALDADHIMAVSVLNSQKTSIKRTLVQSGRWALGHGGMLLCCGILLFGVGVPIPESIQKTAEMSVGVLLIVLGVMCVIRIRKDKLTFERHSHGDIVHAHWYENTHAHTTKHSHKPVFVGMLHGLAGSAPALALIPAVANGQFMPAMLYLVIFSLGVMLSMLFFGLGFAHIQQFLSRRSHVIFQLSRHGLALSSIALGSYWLLQAS